MSFENGAPAIVDQPAFHFSSSPFVSLTDAGTTPNQYNGFGSAFGNLDWNAGNRLDAFGASALSHTLSSPGSTSSGGGVTSGTTGSALATNTASSGLTVNIIYDTSVSSAPSGFMTQVNAAVQYLKSQFNDPITIAVGYGEIGGAALSSGALGESETYLSTYSDAQLVNAMKADATSANDAAAIASLLATNLTGNGTFWVSTAEAKALGLAPSGTSIDGYVGFGSAANLFDYNNADSVTAGQCDFYDVVLHELPEVMGRQTMNGQSFADTIGYEPLDLFRYSAPGVHSFPGTQTGYLSVDNGVTHLANFNTDPGGDFGDWASTKLDAMNALGTPGVTEPVTTADIAAIDVPGCNLASLLAPSRLRCLILPSVD